MEAFQYKWQEPFEAALLESDKGKLQLLIARAELEMFKRYQELDRTPDNDEERALLDHAAMKLRFLQTQKLGFPEVPGAKLEASE